MADIKLCDNCGEIFNPRGAWQALTAVTFTVDGEGQQRRYDSTMELCGACAMDPRRSASPTLRGALGSGRDYVDASRSIVRDQDGGYFAVRPGGRRIGPFSSLESAQAWYDDERPRDEGD